MGATGLFVGSRLATSSGFKSFVDDVHNLLHLRNGLLSEVDYVDSLLGIFSASYSGSFIKEIVQLTTIDLIETDEQIKSFISFHKIHDIVRS
jgi:hypothetical protein